MTGAADSWYHEKESAGLYGVLASVEAGPVKRNLSSAAVTTGALFALGVALSLFTGHCALRGGLRPALVGGGAGLAAWGIDRLPGASFSCCRVSR